MEIESERVEMAMERAYRRLVSRVNIPGFRKGKAPRHLVERMLGREALMNEALDILVPEAYEEAVQETGIDPVSHPHMDIVSAEPLSVKATVPVRPTFQLGNYRSIRQSEEPVEINESQVDEAIERVRDARAEWHKVERGVQSGDMVSMDITARTDTKTFVDGKSQRVIVDPERPIVAAGVAEEIIGMMAGDQKAFDVTLPEDFGDTEIAGQEAAVEVSVTEIREKVVPELNDELSHAVGGFASVEEMRTTARTEIESQSKARSRQELEKSVLSAVVDQTDMELPAAWVEEQAGILLENAKRRLGREGLTIEQFFRFSNLTEEKYREELESTARRQLKRTLVLDAVADAEEIGVSDEEVDAAFQVSISDQQGQA
ncbi:MAG TPA: trigger factor, partial [Chloroflexota bacterium]|nr:trigger factor [Chloroflexota bacterium]